MSRDCPAVGAVPNGEAAAYSLFQPGGQPGEQAVLHLLVIVSDPRHIGRGKVGKDPLDVQPGQIHNGKNLGQRIPVFPAGEPDAAHAGINLQVDPDPLLCL